MALFTNCKEKGRQYFFNCEDLYNGLPLIRGAVDIVFQDGSVAVTNLDATIYVYHPQREYYDRTIFQNESIVLSPDNDEILDVIVKMRPSIFRLRMRFEKK